MNSGVSSTVSRLLLFDRVKVRNDVKQHAEKSAAGLRRYDCAASRPALAARSTTSITQNDRLISRRNTPCAEDFRDAATVDIVVHVSRAQLLARFRQPNARRPTMGLANRVLALGALMAVATMASLPAVAQQQQLIKVSGI
jgi:hypothetical protein